MRQVRDVLRLNAAGVSGNEIARRVGVASSTVRLTLKRLAAAGIDPLDGGARRDLYEILEERYGRRSTILTSQVPVDPRSVAVLRAMLWPPA